jgi:hypothetical protein
MAFLRVVVICPWPTTIVNVLGRYLRADTTNGVEAVLDIAVHKDT